MRSKHIYYSIITALIIVGLYHLFAVGRYSYPEFRLKVGQVSDLDVIAPFSFPVLKPETQLTEEKAETLAGISKPYRISEDQLFEAKSKLDKFFIAVLDPKSAENVTALKTAISSAGFELREEAILPLMNQRGALSLYESMGNSIQSLYKQGIIEDATPDSIQIVQGDELRHVSKAIFLSLAQAREQFQKKYSTGEFSALADDLAPILIKSNLVLDESKLTEISTGLNQQINTTLGIVQQNEIIIRKNARITETDLNKINSLQAAYKNREIGKSSLQTLLLALGLLIFYFIIIYLSNMYFVHTQQKNVNQAVDPLPLNLGFIILVLAAVANNYILGYNNILIPFALTVISAAILIGPEFSIFYGLGSLLVVSPFVNWETYTPVIMILSTMTSIMLIIRYNAFHEYLNIWFYLVLSGILVNLSLGVYKNDPLLTILSNIGFCLISATISVIGILLIVPHYEKKWQRATKQTLLELLDFDHPLLKRLATEAVGTYHHSLIVGNLSERAAEAIGANPLLARVGSYYHDIGKIINTEIFTENNDDSTQIHDGIQPDESANLIKGHVLEGIELAKHYKIPKPVIEIIMQHHGTSHIRYFLEQAKKNQSQPDMQNFTYPGPKPQSKEAVLVMLADIIESTTKAKNISSEADIVTIIDQTIQRLMKENQFDEAPITLKELHIAKETMLPVLESIYRKRLDYPDDKQSDENKA